MSAFTRRAVDEAGRRIRSYAEVQDDLDLIKSFRELRCTGLTELFQLIATALSSEPCVLSCRVKRMDTIIRKLRRESSMDLSRMEDIVAFRIIVPSLAVQHKVQKLLEDKLPIKKVRDYATTSKAAGYRAVHLVLTQELIHPDNGEKYVYPCEIQVRTYYQHLWATTSESFGEQVKEGGGTANIRAYLMELAENIETLENTDPENLQIKDLKTEVAISFTVLVFDKPKQKTINNESFGPRLLDAIKRMLYLEDLYRGSFSQETVMIGVPTGDEEARVTHLRYFTLRGIPELPANIKPAHPRPEK